MRNVTSSVADSINRPFVSVELRPHFDRGEVTTFTSGDSLVSVQLAEGRWGGVINSPGSPFRVSAVITLANPDYSIIDDFRGHHAQISFGGLEGETEHLVEIGNHYVAVQRLVSREGILQTELDLIDLFVYSSLRTEALLDAGGVTLEWSARDPGTDRTVEQILHENLGGSPFDSIIVSRDDVLTDIAYASISRDSEGIRLANLVDGALILKEESDVSLSTYVFFSSVRPFNSVTIDFEDLADVVLSWHVYTGAGSEGWSLVTSDQVFNSEHKLQGFRLRTEEVTPIRSNFGATFGDPFPSVQYYHVRLTIVGDETITATRILGGMDVNISLTTNNSQQRSNYKPTYIGSSGSGLTLITALQSVLPLTRLGLKLTPQGVEAFYIDLDEDPYEFAESTYRLAILEDVIEIPNTQFVRRSQSDDPFVGTRGFAENTDSVERIGEIADTAIDPNISAFSPGHEPADYDPVDSPDRTNRLATASGNALARTLLDNHAYEHRRAELEIPMDFALEIWDLVEFTDARSGHPFSGRVTHLNRIYSQGQYYCRVYLGGVDRMMLRYIPPVSFDFDPIDNSNPIAIALTPENLTLRNAVAQGTGNTSQNQNARDTASVTPVATWSRDFVNTLIPSPFWSRGA